MEPLSAEALIDQKLRDSHFRLESDLRRALVAQFPRVLEINGIPQPAMESDFWLVDIFGDETKGQVIVEERETGKLFRLDYERSDDGLAFDDPVEVQLAYEEILDKALTAKERQRLADTSFAVPAKRKLPLDNAARVRNAMARFNQTKGLTPEEKRQAARRILKAARKFGIDVDEFLERAKRLGLSITDWAEMPVASPSVLSGSYEIVEDGDDKPFRVRMLVTKANTKINGRVYPREALARAIAEAKPLLDNRAMINEYPHPPVICSNCRRVLAPPALGCCPSGRPEFGTDPTHAVSVTTELAMDAHSDVYATDTIFDTDRGRNVKAILRGGGRVGRSQRSYGHFLQAQLNGESLPVAKAIALSGFDWVPNPALSATMQQPQVLTDAEMQALLESAQPAPAEESAETAPAADSAHRECAKCGGQAGANDAFCPSCGASLRDGAEASTDSDTSPSQEKEMDKSKEKDTKDPAAAAAAPPAPVKDAVADAPKPAPAAPPDPLTPEERQTLKDVGDERSATAAKAQVSAFCDSLASAKDLERFPKATREVILNHLRGCATVDAAKALLQQEITIADHSIAAGKLAGMGYPGGTSEKGATVDNPISVGPDRSYMAVVDKILAGFDRYRRTLTPVRVFDAGLAKANRKWFEQNLLPVFEKAYGSTLRESAQCLLDAEGKSGPIRAPRTPELAQIIADSEMPISDAASIGSSNLANQPVVSLAIQIERFQQSLALAAGQAIGPDGFVAAALPGAGRIGAVLRVPVETYTPPAGNVEPNIGEELLGAEDAEIPEATIDLRFQNFAPRWNRLAFSIPTEARQALANGPLNYDAVARGFFHITEHLRRVLDQAFLREVAQTADEFGKVAVASEVATTGDANLTYGAGGSQGGYGTNVVLVVKLRRGGTIAAPKTERPAVRTRTSKKLDADGFIASTVLNDASVSAAVGFTMVDREGYMQDVGNGKEVKGTVGGLAATWAIDWEAGNFIATSVFGWDNGVADNFAISYTYATNLDTWSKTVPSGREPAEYYDTLFEQLDKTTAALRSSPHFTDADLALMSVTASVFFANARIFHSSGSPKGSTLSDPDFAAARAVFADRNGIALVRHNIPWPLADDRVIVGARGATKIGVDTALRTFGPFARYGSNQKLIAGDQFYVEENVVIATPQVLNTSGTVKQAPYRSLRFIA